MPGQIVELHIQCVHCDREWIAVGKGETPEFFPCTGCGAQEGGLRKDDFADGIIYTEEQDQTLC